MIVTDFPVVDLSVQERRERRFTFNLCSGSGGSSVRRTKFDYL